VVVPIFKKKKDRRVFSNYEGFWTWIKAYDHVPRAVLWGAIREYGYQGCLWVPSGPNDLT